MEKSRQQTKQKIDESHNQHAAVESLEKETKTKKLGKIKLAMLATPPFQ